MSSITGAIIAAGKGRRLNSMKKTSFSKAMTVIEGRLLVSFIIDSMIECDIKKIIIVRRNDDLEICKLKEMYESKVEIDFVVDSYMLGSLMSVSLLKDYVSSPFLLSDCDVICKKESFLDMYCNYQDKDSIEVDAFIAQITSPVNNERMVKVVNNRAVSFCKDSYNDGVCGGMVYIFKNKFFDDMGLFLENENYSFSSYLNNYMEKNVVKTMSISKMWDVDTLEDIERTKKLLIEEEVSRESI